MNTEAFFKITYGLYIISSQNDEIKNGYVANTAFQVTAEPAQIAISCNKDNFTCDLIKKSGFFSISVLKQETKSDLIGLFGYQSGRTTNKFESTQHIVSENKTPIVTEDSIAWFECKVVSNVDVGTHLMFIAEIIDNDLLDAQARPLTYAYYHEVKKGFAPKNAPTYIDQSKLDGKTQESHKDNKYQCSICKYIYDPELGDLDHGIPPGTNFEDLGENWSCPVCGAPKSAFNKL